LRNHLLFLTLKTFSATGGIEKVCRIAGKAMYENATRFQKRMKIFSMHDKQEDCWDNKYFPSEIFKGFAVAKSKFVIEAVRTGIISEIVVLSHINLLVAGWIIKRLSPKTRVILLAHGIEIWGDIGSVKKKMLKSLDEIVSVSAYTAEKVHNQHQIEKQKCSVINNCLDPFLPLPANAEISENLHRRYGFKKDDKILLTLTRLSSTERYKGYDKVMEALSLIEDENIKYLIAGSYDPEEKIYLTQKVENYQLDGRITFTGFLPDHELAAHFALADLYVMPSWKEGFGIVFIEAMYYGLPVIAGNEDGSVDALKNGQLGLLVNPKNVASIKDAILKVVNQPEQFIPDSKLLLQNFSYDNYKVQINAMLARHYTLN